MVAAVSFAALALIGTLVLASVVLFDAARGAYGATGDFIAFYAAGTIVRTGDGAHLYNAAVQESVERATYTAGFKNYNAYPFPVFAAWMFAPLTLLSFTKAYLVWMGLNALLLAALAKALARYLRSVPVLPRRVFLGIFTLSMPSVAVILFGQVDLILFASIFAAYMLSRDGRHGMAGLALAPVLMKPHLLAGIVLLLLLQRRWDTLRSLAGVGVPLLVVPALLTSPGTLISNFSLIGRYPGAERDLSVNAPMMSNWRGFVVSTTGQTDPMFWLPGLAAIALAALAIALPRWRRAGQNAAAAEQAWALAILFPLVASPHLHTQSLVLGFIPAAIALRRIFELRAARADDRLDMNVIAGLLLLFGTVFTLWLVTTMGLALLVFVVLGAFWCCAYRWPRQSRAERLRLTAATRDASPERARAA
jgi:hypothetical protein